MEHKEQIFNSFENEESNINIREIVEQYLYFWKWFVLGLVLALLGAYLYLLYSTPTYKVESKILMLDESNSMAGELAALSDLSILSDGGKTNVDDQIEILKSRRLMIEVAKELNLNVQYFSEGRIKTTEIYKDNSPIKLAQFTALDLENDTIRAEFAVKVLSATEYQIKDENRNFSAKAKFGQKINSPIGEIMILPNGKNF